MKNLVKNKITGWLVAILIIANIATLVFFWIGHFRNQRNNSPKEFLANKLHFSNNQKNIYFNLAKEHNETARGIRKEIKLNKEAFFNLLKSDYVSDSAKAKAALEISLSIKSLDILTFEHFEKVRAICTPLQKKIFDDLVQKMVNSVNNPQQDTPPSIKEKAD
jgi:glycerophosphoryl diester phosphodiesterase